MARITTVTVSNADAQKELAEATREGKEFIYLYWPPFVRPSH